MNDQRDRIKTILEQCKKLKENVKIRRPVKTSIESILYDAERELQAWQTPTQEVQEIIKQAGAKANEYLNAKKNNTLSSIEWVFSSKDKDYYEVAARGQYSPSRMNASDTNRPVIIVGSGKFLGHTAKGFYYVLEDKYTETNENGNRIFWAPRACFEDTGFQKAKSKAVEKDPELKESDRGEVWRVKEGKAKSIENGKITSKVYPGSITVTDVQEFNRQYLIFPAGKKLYAKASTEGDSYPANTEDTQATIIQEKNGFAQCKLAGYKGEYWIPKKDLIETKEDGYKCKYFDYEVWVAKNDLEKSQAGYTDKSNASLFPEDPKPDDVLQGGLGDCYLLAALASLAKTDPNYIKGMMRDNEDAKDGKGGTVTVRLYDVSESYGDFKTDKKGNTTSYQKKTFKAKPLYIKINKSVVQQNGEDLYAEKYLWVQMIEKAYAASGSRGNPHKDKPDVKSSYENIIGGSSAYAWEVLTGKESSYTQLSKIETVRSEIEKDEQGNVVKDEEGKDKIKVLEEKNTVLVKKKQILNKIKDALDQGKAVGAGSRRLMVQETSQGKGHSAGEKILDDITATHAYTILAVDVDKQQIQLRNPWGQKEKQNGDIFLLNVDTFLRRFDGLYISGEIY